MSAKKLKIHFIGIGGIGVSALARYYLAQGHEVSGSDLVSSEITDALKKIGAEIYIGSHTSRTLLDVVDLVIYSQAVQKSNPELKRAYELRIKNNELRIMSYPHALGELTKKYFTIAVSGTHGKSTTTAMLGLLLAKAGLDPTVIVGTKLKEFGDSNYRVGKSSYLVIEADEHMASFLNYWPKIIVLTTVEADHLDYYKNLNNILKTFRKYIGHLPKDGVLVVNRDDRNIAKLLNGCTAKWFSLKQLEVGKLRKLMKVPGEHNVSNALAPLAVARALKIPDKISFKALSEYRGSWRRFEEKECKIPNTKYKIQVINDYGHHPTEVRVTLKAVREKYPKKKIWCVFQPHQYQRTYYLFKDFVKVLRKAPVDKLIITDIYDVAGRETPEMKKKVSAEKLVKAVDKKSVFYLPENEILDYLRRNLRGGEAIVVMGAGNIYELAVRLTEESNRGKMR